jgi:hypothetical protein
VALRWACTLTNNALARNRITINNDGFPNISSVRGWSIKHTLFKSTPAATVRLGMALGNPNAFLWHYYYCRAEIAPRDIPGYVKRKLVTMNTTMDEIYNHLIRMRVTPDEVFDATEQSYNALWYVFN